MRIRPASLALIAALMLAVPVRAETPSVTAAPPSPDTDPMPTAQPRHFLPYTASEPKGELDLSATSAVFSKMKGGLVLQYVGTMPESRDFDTSEAALYKVTNGDAVFQANRGKAGPCPQPIRWLTVRALGSLTIRVSLLTIADWKAYKPDGVGRCSGATYQLPGAKSGNDTLMPGGPGKANPPPKAKNPTPATP